MLAVSLKLFLMVVLVVLAVCIWKTGEYFNTLPESSQYKPVIAWDLMILFFLAVGLIWKLIVM